MRNFVVFTQKFPLLRFIYLGIYRFSLQIFLFWLRFFFDRKKVVYAIYLRRGGAQLGFVPGASDIDLQIFIRDVPSFQEWDWLSKFWRAYRIWRKLFPFLGEGIIQTQQEWAWTFSLGIIRALEAKDWRYLAGEKMDFSILPPVISYSDLATETLKSWRGLLQSLFLLKTQKQNKLIHHRELAKCFLDILRFHATLSAAESKIVYSRKEAWEKNAPTIFSDLEIVWLNQAMQAKAAIMQEPMPTKLLGLAWNYLQNILLAVPNPGIRQEWESRDSLPQDIRADKASPFSDRAPQVVAEMMAERWSRRHAMIRRVLFHTQGQSFFLFLRANTSPAELERFAIDAGAAMTAFAEFGSCMILPEFAFAKLPQLNMGDHPFRFHEWHSELLVTPKFNIHFVRQVEGAFTQASQNIALAHLLYLQRLPPEPYSFWRGQIVGVLLRARVRQGGVADNGSEAEIMQQYARLYPAREKQLTEAFSHKNALEVWGHAYPWIQMETRTWLDSLAGRQEKFQP